MKVHLFKSVLKRDIIEMQCGHKLNQWLSDYETIDTNAVTCENCKKSQGFKDLEKSNNETKKAIEEMNKIKEDAISDFKESEPETYKQTITIEIEVPTNMEVDIAKFTGKTYSPDFKNGTAFLNVILKPKVKTGSDLCGCLCGLSCTDIESAKQYSEAMQSIGVVISYRDNTYYTSCGSFTEAYPVSSKKLNQLKKRLEK